MIISKEENNEWYQHEGLDRVDTILIMLQQLLGNCEDEFSLHPSLHNKKCRKLVDKARKSLEKLYQEIGEWEDEESNRTYTQICE